MKRIFILLLTAALVSVLAGCGEAEQRETSAPSEPAQTMNQDAAAPGGSVTPEIIPPENFIRISGGTFQMGSPESEAWRLEDETVHAVTVGAFYIRRYEVTQQAQEAQNAQDRPDLSTHVEDMEQYDTIILGHPNWWASIPMPVASFLEECDFTGKTIVPFCSHGGGRFGQSLTAITKLAPTW